MVVRVGYPDAIVPIDGHAAGDGELSRSAALLEKGYEAIQEIALGPTRSGKPRYEFELLKLKSNPTQAD